MFSSGGVVVVRRGREKGATEGEVERTHERKGPEGI